MKTKNNLKISYRYYIINFTNKGNELPVTELISFSIVDFNRDIPGDIVA